MTMHWIDWAVVLGFLSFITFVALSTRKYTKAVADFLVAGRGAGRFLTGIARDAVSIGAITMLAHMQVYYLRGFTPIWWGFMMLPVHLIIAMTGWVIYRFRQTRAMTVAQFFEVRYSRRFRVFSGMVAFFAGIINFGIFPAIGSRLLVHFCGLPSGLIIMGITVPTFALVMIVMIGISLVYCFIGGQVTVLLTDFTQSMFLNVMFIIIAFVLFSQFSWEQISASLLSAPSGASMIHPFHTSKVKDFGVTFFMVAVFVQFFSRFGWQGSANYMSSAKNAHEAKMGEVIGQLRLFARSLFYVMIPICAFVFLNHPDFADRAADANLVMENIKNTESAYVSGRMAVPLALSHLLPIGLMGGFCAVVMAAFISTHDTYLINWGSVFVQDVLMPLRKKPFSAEAHMKILRFSILGVALFIFFFSLLFELKQLILMFFALTGLVYLGGHAAVMVGGLYWKRGTTAAAWTAMSASAIMGTSCIILKAIDKSAVPEFLLPIYEMSSQHLLFYGMSSCIILYVIVSLLGKKPDRDFDRIFNRGKYTVQEDVAAGDKKATARGLRAIGMSKEFTRGDKVIYLLAMAKIVLFFSGFLIFTIYNLVFDVADKSWLSFWKFYVYFLFVVAIITTIWVGIGGIFDLKFLINKLKTAKRDEHDDGWISQQTETKEKDEKGDFTPAAK